MESKAIRAKFLEFFNSKSHKIVPSAPIVVQNDPTLMFTNAGMNQFKDYFLGNKTPEANRVADTQKCLRVSGKHNDLEEVGLDTYHHTMFEMLGNWSFGDYFKKEAIEWAWEFLTEVCGLPADRMYATVFEGDPSDGLKADEEARGYWKSIIPEERILNGNKKDNFWEMGDTGPCGPCSEIHIDLRSDEEVQKVNGRELVNQDHPLVVEIWNLVFMQFNRQADGSLKNLPQQHVDTGMGFERLAMAVQGKQSNYDTDVFQPLIQMVAKRAGVTYGKDEKIDIAIRVIADHIRAISFTIADGQLPGNAKAGYVIRRILRRAVRYGYTFLNFKEPFLTDLVSLLADQFKEVFPELDAQRAFVAKVVREEEVSFLRTLDKGLKRFEGIKAEMDGKVIDGQKAFELYDTYGFPLDLTSLIARENGLSVDESAFQQEMEKQKARSKSAAQQSTGDWIVVHEADTSEFLGYEQLQATSKITRYREVKQKNKSFFQIVLDQTPFYAESGGQVGDTGVLETADEKVVIFDTKKENDLIVHYAKALPKNLEATFEAKVNATRRKLTENNHSATHLLHAALREVLGDHVQQKGSLVNDEVLRFDFSHFAKVTDEEIAQVEAIVNRKIRENIALGEKRNVPIAEAQEMGAMALFGEKYGEFVRVITFDPEYSVELCGGTHVPATGQIGLLKIVSESSVAAGVRRVEAITADKAEAYVQGQLNLLAELKELLKNPNDPKKAVASLLDERNQLQKQLEELNLQQGSALKKELLDAAQEINGVRLITQEVKLPDANVLKQLSFELKNEVSNVLVVLAANLNEKPMLSVIMDESLVKAHGLNAGEMVRAMAKEIQGGGGGQPFYATAGGKNVAGLAAALQVGKQLIGEKLNTEIK
ncbi:alanine--tRNA ligase [Marinoscillum furvescens]|uniref:Alanine--tRNA ligase n=1 Tax=Marinoscillum furvescens DSM 4134 TaxID=1122208 RepID=A0A3D9KZ88_MARFU|nr:alanine--tRNA ligase [Marinoscillum furvescens]RED95609.1 alanyl-tRNA synthetase [Marinoscillum furvescens DSM 4134]